MKQVLYFSTAWCSACKTTSPIIEQLSKSGTAQVTKVDADYDVSLVEQYKIRSIPTIIVLEEGNEIKRYVGAINYDQLTKLING